MKLLTLFGMLLLFATAPIYADDTASVEEMAAGQVPLSVKTKMPTVDSVVTEEDVADLERHPNCLTNCWKSFKPKFEAVKDKAKAFVVKADAWMDSALAHAGDMLDWANAHQDQFWGLSKFALQLIGDDDLRKKVEGLEKKSKYYGEKAKKVLGMVDAAQDVLRVHAVAISGIEHDELKRKVQNIFMDLMVASADGKSNSRIFKSSGAQLSFGYEDPDGVTVPLITFGADLAKKDVVNDEPVNGYTVAEQAKVSAMLGSLDGNIPGLSELDKTLLRKTVNSLVTYGGEVVVNDTNTEVNGVRPRSVYVWAVGDENKDLPPIFKFHVPAPVVGAEPAPVEEEAEAGTVVSGPTAEPAPVEEEEEAEAEAGTVVSGPTAEPAPVEEEEEAEAEAGTVVFGPTTELDA